ncbi:MAG: hypothetical protein HYW25_04540 [Candidatus Aenigmarchaeota archaeon]|nr:hypothetical protein [Candidatus Aenigmarchaeota archaeon]
MSNERLIVEGVRAKWRRIGEYIGQVFDMGTDLCNLYRDYIIGTRERDWDNHRRRADTHNFWREVQSILPPYLHFTEEEMNLVEGDVAAADQMAIALGRYHPEFSRLGTEFHVRK